MYAQAVCKVENVFFIKELDSELLYISDGYPIAFIYGTLSGIRRAFRFIRRGRNTGVPIYEIINE